MYSVKGVLSTGDKVSGAVPANTPHEALKAVHDSLPEGATIATITVAKLEAGTLNISKPRTRTPKDSPAAAVAEAATPTATKRK